MEREDRIFENIIKILFETQVSAHYYHLNTRSYAIHNALGKYYDGITEEIDNFAELYMGMCTDYERIHAPESISLSYNLHDSELYSYFDEVANKLEEKYLKYGFESEILRDRLTQIIQFIRKTVYLLNRLQ